MPKVVFHSFENASAPVSSGVYFPTVDPIMVALSHKRRPAFELPPNFPLWFMTVVVLLAAAATGAFILGAASVQQPAKPLPVATAAPAAPVAKAAAAEAPTLPADPYFIRADDEPKIAPLPVEAFSNKGISLLPLLKRLPVGREMREAMNVPLPPPPKKHFADAIAISVTRDPALDAADRLTRSASEEAAAGHNENAIRLYEEAWRFNPKDGDTTYNLVALLLQKAAFFDRREDWASAMPIYEKALRLWNVNDDMGQSIRARLEWVRGKIRPAALSQ